MHLVGKHDICCFAVQLEHELVHHISLQPDAVTYAVT